MASTIRNYEAMVIIKSILPEETITGVIDKLSEVLTAGGATLKETARWGRRKLAYEISKQAEGYYVIYYFTLDGSAAVLETFERTCRYDENVLRHMIVNVPTRKRGLEIAQIVPSPGWLSEYNFQPRPMMRRPRPMRDSEPMRDNSEPVAAPAAVAEPAAAPAPESAPAADAPQA